ncbi:MAG: RHS repeat-associated core domain-containing protein [Putridiphycobacter sp.]
MEYKKYLKQKDFSPGTIKSYQIVANRFNKWLKDQELHTSQITYNDVTAYINYMQGKRNKQRTIQLEIGALKHYLNYQNVIGNAPKIPIQNLKIQGVKRQHIYTIFTTEKLSKIESMIYGGSRLGMETSNIDVNTTYDPLTVCHTDGLQSAVVEIGSQTITAPPFNTYNYSNLRLTLDGQELAYINTNNYSTTLEYANALIDRINELHPELTTTLYDLGNGTTYNIEIKEDVAGALSGGIELQTYEFPSYIDPVTQATTYSHTHYNATSYPQSILRAPTAGACYSDRQLGTKMYELSNHLGNVMEVITDRKIGEDVGTYDINGNFVSATLDGVVDYYLADIVSYSDYYPYGMQMPGRQGTLSGGEYRYAFNGMETDKEVSGQGNSYTTMFRQYDPRLGRWKSLDPLAGKYPNQSPFAAFNNNPLYFTDPLGLEGEPENSGAEDKPKKGDKRVVDFTNGDQQLYIYDGKQWKLAGTLYNISTKTATPPKGRTDIDKTHVMNFGDVTTGEDNLVGGGSSGKPVRTPSSWEGKTFVSEYGNESDADLEEYVRDGIWWADFKSEWLDGTGSLEDDLNKITDEFTKGNGGVVTGFNSAEEMMEKSKPYNDMVDELSSQFKKEFKKHGSDYSKYEITIEKTPNFSDVNLSLKALVGGTQQVDVFIVATYMDTQGNLHAVVKIIIWDTFGVSEDDFIKYNGGELKEQAKKKAVGSFWILQHQRGYKPVITKFVFTEDIIINN